MYREPDGSFFMERKHTAIIGELHKVGAAKIDFNKGWTLKSGLWSPIYINLRILQSHPKLLTDIASELKKLIVKKNVRYDSIASIPLGGLPLGIALSLATRKPHILPRMDSKKHGLGVKVDGIYSKGDQVLLVDDLITAATSKLEAIEELNKAGLTVEDILVVLDRQQGGKEILTQKKFNLHALFTFDEFLKSLLMQKKISREIYLKITDYLEKTKK